MPGVPLGLTLDEAERRYILETLQDSGGNKSLTARKLGISVRSLYYKLAQEKDRSEPAQSDQVELQS